LTFLRLAGIRCAPGHWIGNRHSAARTRRSFTGPERRPGDMAMAARQSRGRAWDGKQDARRFPRQTVSWIFSVSTGSGQLQGRTKDTSAAGAKILLDERLPLGSQVLLQFRPPGRSAVETQALVWRLDVDGFACVFVGSPGAKFLETVTPPREAVAVARPSEIRRDGTVLLALMDPKLRELALAALGGGGGPGPPGRAPPTPARRVG